MPRNRIDVHAHYVGGAVADLFRSGFNPANGYRFPVQWTTDEALAFMDRHGIAAQILSVPWTFDAGVARRINEELAALIDQHPTRFGAFAAIPGDNPDAMLAEIEHALDALHLDGVLLNSNIQGRYSGTPSMEPVVAELARRRTPVFVHPCDSPPLRELSLGRPSSVVEFPFDTARTITDALYHGVFRRHPDLTLILAHCGGPLPALAWRIAEHTTMAIGPDDEPLDPNHVADALRALYYDTALAGSRNSLLPTLEVTGVGQLLYGSDWPAAPEHAVVHNNENLAAYGFSEPDRDAVDCGNAARLFPRFA